MFSKSEPLIKYIEKEVDRLRTELEEVNRIISSFDYQIGKHNTEVRRLCKEREPFIEKYHKLYEQKKLVEKTLEYAQNLEKEN